jgi:hypothetical protein
MSEYILLYRNTAEARDQAMGTPEKAKASMAKWMAWMKEMREKGHLKDPGFPLEGAGKVVSGKRRKVTDGPFTETKELVGGFSVIEAKDLDEAAVVASGCPILEGEGSVEIRPVVRMGP